MEPITVLFIPADESRPIETREIIPDLDGLKSLVGGYLEVVGLTNPLATMYVDMDGKSKGLPVNARATFLGISQNHMLGDFIVGDVFICGVPDAGGIDTDCPPFYQGA